MSEPHATPPSPLQNSPRPAAARAPVVQNRRLLAWHRDRILAAASILLVLAFPAVFFGFEVYMFIGPMMIPSVLALIVLLAWDRPWAYLTAGILGTLFPLAILVMMGVFGGQIANPLVALEFSANLIMIFALALLWSGVIPAFRRGRTGARSHAPAIGRQTFLLVAGAALIVGAIGTSFAAEDQAVGHFGGGYDFAAPATVELAIIETFTPDELVITQGVITEVVVENRGRESHTFTYRNGGQLYDHFLPASQTVAFLVLFEETGSVDFWCVPHSNGADDDGTGMVGSFTVVAA